MTLAPVPLPVPCGAPHFDSTTFSCCRCDYTIESLDSIVVGVQRNPLIIRIDIPKPQSHHVTAPAATLENVRKSHTQHATLVSHFLQAWLSNVQLLLNRL